MDRNRVARAVGLIAWGISPAVLPFDSGYHCSGTKLALLYFFLKGNGGTGTSCPRCEAAVSSGGASGSLGGAAVGDVRCGDTGFYPAVRPSAGCLRADDLLSFSVSDQFGGDCGAGNASPTHPPSLSAHHPYAVYHSHGAPDCLDGGLSSGGCTWNCRCGDWNLYLRGFVWPAESIEKRRPAAAAGDGKVETEAF